MTRRFVFYVILLASILLAIAPFGLGDSFTDTEDPATTQVQVQEVPEYDGSWSIDDVFSVEVSKVSKTYWIGLDRLDGYYAGGLPKHVRVKTLSIPIQGKQGYVARGRFFCYRKAKGFPDNSIVVLLKNNVPVSSWIVSDNNFVKINPSSVICETDEHEAR
jgi:hypothetical protein